MKERLPAALRKSIAAYIAANYIAPTQPTIYGAAAMRKSRMLQAERGETFSMEEAAAPLEAPASLKEMLEQMDAGFSETLLRLIDATGKKDADVYKKANLSKQHFSKIRNNPEYRPTKPTAIALALALELDLEKTQDLIGRAGYALNFNSKFDLIIRYFILQKQYDIMQINMALFDFDQPLLGG